MCMFKKWMVGMLISTMPCTVMARQVLDRVVVVVNDDILTETEVERTFAPLKKQLVETLEGEALRAKILEGKKDIMERLVDQLLIYQDSQSKGLTIKSVEIDESVDKIKMKFGNPSDFREALSRQGISEFAFRKNIEKQLYTNKYRQYFVNQSVEVSASDLDAYYEKHKKSFIESEEVRASQIFIPMNADEAFAEKKIKEIYESLLSGEDFSELSKQFSKGPNAAKGGDLGFLKSGQMLKEVDDSLSRMFIGDNSGIIKSSAGFHILKLTARKQPRQLLLSDVEDKIRKNVYAIKAEEKYHQLIKKLRDNAFIEYKVELE